MLPPSEVLWFETPLPCIHIQFSLWPHQSKIKQSWLAILGCGWACDVEIVQRNYEKRCLCACGLGGETLISTTVFQNLNRTGTNLIYVDWSGQGFGELNYYMNYMNVICFSNSISFPQIILSKFYFLRLCSCLIICLHSSKYLYPLWEIPDSKDV